MIIRKGEVLFYQGEESDIYLLKKGLLKVVRSQLDGSCFLFNILIPGEIFPHHSLLNPMNNFGSVSAISESEVQCIPKEKWYRDMEKNPHKYREVALALQHTLRKVQRRTELLVVPPKRRIPMFREWLATLDIEIKIDELLTQEEVGQFLGLTRETVNRLLHTEKVSV